MKNVVKATFLVGATLMLSISSCKQKEAKEEKENTVAEVEAATPSPFFKLSLAQWSMHRMIREEGVSPYKFAEKAKAWGFEGLEYVSQLYKEELEAANYSAEAMQNFVDKSNAEAEKHGLKNLLIMVDRQGDLAAVDAAERKAAVENHYKWVDAAAGMGCHSVRVNLNGAYNYEQWVPSAVDGLRQLATYAKDKNINVIVENHGGPSSNGAWLAEVMTKVDMPNCGTLPDFGNFCTNKAGADHRGECLEHYDIYKGVTELMPFAIAVSAKSHDFDEAGNEIHIDYPKMLKIVKDAGYTGYIGVEYEGNELR